MTKFILIKSIWIFLLIFTIANVSLCETNCLAPKKIDNEVLINEYKKVHPWHFNFFKVSGNDNNAGFFDSICSRFAKTTLAVAFTVALTTCATTTPETIKQVNPPEIVLNSEQKKAPVTDLKQVLNSDIFKAFSTGFTKREITSINDERIVVFLDMLEKAAPDLKNIMKKILEDIVNEDEIFLAEFEKRLDPENKYDMLLKDYINELKSSPKSIDKHTFYLSKKTRKHIIEKYSQNYTTTFDEKEFGDRADHIWLKTLRFVDDKIIKFWNDNLDAWISKGIYMHMENAGDSFIPCEIIHKNKYTINGKDFQVLRISFLDKQIKAASEGAGGYAPYSLSNYVLIFDEGWKNNAEELYKLVYSNGKEKILFSKYDGKNVRKLGYAFQDYIRKKHPANLSTQDIARYLINYAENHEIQHMINQPKTLEIDDNEESAYIAGICRTDIPVCVTIYHIISTVIRHDASPARYSMIRIIWDFINFAPEKGIKFSSDELSITKLYDMKLEDDKSIELTLKLLNYFNLYTDDEIRTYLEEIHLKRFKEPIHKELKILDRTYQELKLYKSVKLAA